MLFALRLLFVVTCALGAALATAEAQDAPKLPFVDGVSPPQVVKEVKPQYARKAKAAKIQGVVVMEVVVRSDGHVGSVKVVQSLDSKYGLDDEAVKAAKKWLFKPGTKDGKPVAVLVTIEMSFVLKKR